MSESVILAQVQLGLDTEIRSTCRNVLLDFLKTDKGKYVEQYAIRVYTDWEIVNEYEGGMMSIWGEFKDSDAVMYILTQGWE